MEIKATGSGMKNFTTQELRDHVIAVDAKVKEAPAFIRRTNYSRWVSNKSAILREIAKREEV
jgi:hypothetical protein